MIEISKIITALTNGLIFALAIIGCNNNISVKDNLSKIKKKYYDKQFKKMLKLGQMPGIW